MTIPELATDRLRMRGWREDDVEPLAAINADPRVGRWLGGTLTTDETRQRITDYLYAWDEQGFGMWAVEERGSGRLVGRVGLMHWTDWTASPHDAEIGWTFHPDVWRRGYATEAAREALRWGLEERGLERIISITLPTNLASRRVMEKLGLTYRGEAFWRGFDQVWYGIEREAWAARRQARAKGA